MIHCKTMLVDDHLGLVGSANMDTRSFRLNFEVHTLVHDLSLAKELALAFEKDRAVARRIDAAEWRARPWPSRVAEGSARLISPIL
jgi:cardiolipin synthase